MRWDIVRLARPPRFLQPRQPKKACEELERLHPPGTIRANDGPNAQWLHNKLSGPLPGGSPSGSSGYRRAEVKYLPHIDGLRGIAVLSLLLRHLSPSLFPGGFVGVDIFFVISGFLITSQVHREACEGTFSLKQF